jgi:hypothetical protein
MNRFVGAIVSITLAMASAVHAETILREDFNGTIGSAVAGANGWAGNTNILVSNSTIDQGTSANWADATSGNSPSAWPAVAKGFSHTPVAGDTYTLTGTIVCDLTEGAYTDLRISDGKGSTFNIGTNIYGYGGSSAVLKFGLANVLDHYIVNLTTPDVLDVKFVMQDQKVEYFYKSHSNSVWTDVGGKGLDDTFTLSKFNTIEVWGHGGCPGGIDSVLLTSSVPEPGTCALLASGVVGLLAYAWRKRR